MVEKGYIKCIYIFIAIVFAVSILYVSTSFESAFAQKNDKDDEEDEDKLIIKANINLKNVDIENTKFIRIIGFINGEEIIKSF